MVTAQDKALAVICVERGHLDDSAIDRARLAHAEARESGGAPPLGQLLVQGGFLNPRLASELLRELALSTYHCAKCRRVWNYDGLAQLARYRCDGCGERLERSMRSPTGRFLAPAPDATEVVPGRVARGSSVSQAVLPAPERATATRPSGTEPVGALAEARRIGPYEIVNELGRGAMGVVYLARRPGLERSFAIKVLLSGLLSDAEAVERFRREAQLSSRIQHPSVVSVYDVGVTGGVYYYVMDYCAGRTLKDTLHERKRYPVREAVELVAKIARGVAAAHALGIVHRDLKPANIVIDEKTREPKIMDFGLARDAASSALSMTKTGDMVGTPSYASPEQLTGKKGVDARADVYALGIVLYELISGARPFLADTVAHLAAMVLTETPPPLKSRVPEVPAPIDAIVTKALSKRAAERYPSAAELAADLERYLAGETVAARPAKGPPRKLAKVALVIAVLLAVAAAAGGAGVFYLRDQALERARASLQALKTKADGGSELADIAPELSALRASAPPAMAEPIDLVWASVLERRGRTEAARSLAAPYVDAPGEDGLLARRIVASALVASRQIQDAEPLLDALVAATGTADAAWAQLVRALTHPGGPAPPAALRDHVAGSKDLRAIEVLGELEMRERHEDRARELLERVLRAAPDDAAAHLALATLLRRDHNVPWLRSHEDERPRALVQAYFALAGPEVEQTGIALYHRALGSLVRGEVQDMIADLDGALARGFDTVEANALRAWLLDERGRRCHDRARVLDEGRAKNLEPETADRARMATVVAAGVIASIDATVAQAQEPARLDLAAALRASARGELFEKVKDSFDAAAVRAPGCPVVALEKARFLVSRCRMRAAHDAIEAARGAGADANDLALLELELGLRTIDTAGARAAAQRLVTADPDGWRGHVARSYRALALDPRGPDTATALAEARTAVEVAPREAAAHRALANALLESDVAGALVEARVALAIGARLDVENAVVDLVAESYTAADHLEQEFMRRAAEMADNFTHQRDLGGRGGAGGGGMLAGLFAPIFTPWDDLQKTLPSPRVYFAEGLVALHFAQRFPSREEGPGRRALEFAKQYFESAQQADRDCPAGDATLGLWNLLAGSSDGAVESWRRARHILPTWCLPPEWAVPASQPLRDEFLAPPNDGGAPNPH